MTAGHIYTSHIKDPLSLKSLERHIEVAPEILQKELVLQNIHLVSDSNTPLENVSWSPCSTD